MSDFLNLIDNGPFTIRSPFRWRTKSDIIKCIVQHDGSNLLSSSISCSATFQKAELGRQCGKCSQCVERRLAAFAAGAGDIDSDCSYAFDFVRDPIEDGECRGLLIDYLRTALQFARNSEEWFAISKNPELSQMIEYVEGKDTTERITSIWRLCRQHGSEVFDAIRRIRAQYDDPMKLRPKRSLLDIVEGREYLKEPVKNMVERLDSLFKVALPRAFGTRFPAHENVINDQIDALLAAIREDFEKEFPVIRFGTARAIPDHSSAKLDLFVESKYPRPKASPGKLTGEIAEDTVKYGKHVHILFVVYDPHRAIKNDKKFAEPFERDGKCTICFVR